METYQSGVQRHAIISTELRAVETKPWQRDRKGDGEGESGRMISILRGQCDSEFEHGQDGHDGEEKCEFGSHPV